MSPEYSLGIKKNKGCYKDKVEAWIYINRLSQIDISGVRTTENKIFIKIAITSDTLFSHLIPHSFRVKIKY